MFTLIPKKCNKGKREYFMERTSLLYKFRRKLQVLAHKIVPDAAMSKLYFRIVLKKKLDLKTPKTFNEKLQWLKLYYFPNDPLVVRCADKYAVRSYIEEKGYGSTLVPLAGAFHSADEIDWDALPEQFVLKCNHGCAYNIVCESKAALDKAAVSKQLTEWMREDFGAFNIELHYSKITPHMITCEEYLGEKLTDYKFFCFNGEPKFIYVSSDLINDRSASIGFFNLDGSKMELRREDYTDIESVSFPPYFDSMLNMARDLCAAFPFVRVDFFVTENTFYFAELTFTPSACMMPLNPEKYDYEWGDMLNVDDLINGKAEKK